MRFVPVDTSPVTFVTGDELKPVAATRSIRPVAARVNPAVVVRHYKEHRLDRLSLASGEQAESGRRVSGQDRRKVARRINHVPVLLEQRSGIDRRRKNLRDGDIVEHIDVVV